jgi:hypothetical protein
MLRAAPRAFNSWDAIKLFAILTMFIDHSGAFIFTEETDRWLRAVGRAAAPIFLFLGGFASSYRFKWDLFILAMLMTVSDTMLAGQLRTQNILVTIILCRMLLDWLERKGKTIKHPYQWLIGSFAWIGTVMLTQYGTLGLMFALCGYARRRSTLYSKQVQNRMLVISLVAFGAISWLSFEFVAHEAAIMLVMLAIVYWLLSKLELRDIDTGRCPKWLVWVGKTLSTYSGYVYALHLIALEWITGIPF